MSDQTEEKDPTEIPEDDPSQQSPERDRVEAERKLSPPEEAEGGERGEEGEGEDEEVQQVQQEREQAAEEGRSPKPAAQRGRRQPDSSDAT